MYAKVTGMRTGEERVRALRTLLRTQDTPIHGCRLAYTNGREPPWGVGTQAKGYSKVPPPGYPPGSPGGIALSPNRLRYIEPGRAGGAGSGTLALPPRAPPHRPHLTAYTPV